MSMCSNFLCCWKRVFAISLSKTLLAFDLLHFIFQDQACLLLQVSLDFLCLHSSPLWWEVLFFFFFLAFVLKGLVGLHRTINLLFFGIRGWDINFDSVMLSGLPWKGTKIILSLLRLHPNTIFCLVGWFLLWGLFHIF